MTTRWGDRFRRLREMEGAKQFISKTKSKYANKLDGWEQSMSIKNWWKSKLAKTSEGIKEPSEKWLQKMQSWYRKPESEKVEKVETSLKSIEDGVSDSLEAAAEKKRRPLHDRLPRADTNSKR
ncbi:hypothetical protein BDZ45DRAFT_674311 [Acephala macrosclerotiorum]|nr:hypothetical protein BDZ45DRAFT_674311 [Acephala macrosclerotiorum]